MNQTTGIPDGKRVLHSPGSTTSDRPCSVVYLGLDDFPLGLAETQKALLVAQGLVAEGCRVTVVSRWWNSSWHDMSGLKPEGTYKGVDYVNACGYLTRPSGWLRRKFVRLRGLVREVLIVAKLRRTGRLDAGIVSSFVFSRVAFSRLLSKLFGFPLIVHLVEDYGAIPKSTTSRKWKRNAWLFDRHVYKLVDGVLPISRYLVERVEQYAPGKPWLKDPGLVDLDRFAGLARKPGKPYLLFCGYLGYIEIIRFIADAFDRAAIPPDAELRLVVNGSPRDREAFENYRKGLPKGDRIIIISDITDRELSQLYLDAYALLIPLRPTNQDRARFPHKIGEYCGSCRPLITTAVGEVGERFHHGVNAYVAARYDVDDYARAIEEAFANPERADAIGRAGRTTAEEQLDFRRFGPAMKKFVLQLAARE